MSGYIQFINFSFYIHRYIPSTWLAVCFFPFQNLFSLDYIRTSHLWFLLKKCFCHCITMQILYYKTHCCYHKSWEKDPSNYFFISKYQWSHFLGELLKMFSCLIIRQLESASTFRRMGKDSIVIISFNDIAFKLAFILTTL